MMSLEKSLTASRLRSPAMTTSRRALLTASVVAATAACMRVAISLRRVSTSACRRGAILLKRHAAKVGVEVVGGFGELARKVAFR